MRMLPLSSIAHPPTPIFTLMPMLPSPCVDQPVKNLLKSSIWQLMLFRTLSQPSIHIVILLQRQHNHLPMQSTALPSPTSLPVALSQLLTISITCPSFNHLCWISISLRTDRYWCQSFPDEPQALFSSLLCLQRILPVPYTSHWHNRLQVRWHPSGWARLSAHLSTKSKGLSIDTLLLLPQSVLHYC